MPACFSKYLVALLFFWCAFLSAQITDSLEKSLTGLKEDTNKVISLNSLSSQLSRTRTTDALKYATDAAFLAQKINYKRGEAGAYSRMGIIHYYRGDLAQSLNYILKGLKIYEGLNHKKGIASSESLLGVVYNAKSDFQRALEHYHIALRMNTELGDKPGMAAAYNNISLAHFFKKEYENTLVNYEKALALFMELGDSSNAAVALTNMANVYGEITNYGKAEFYYERSVGIKKRSGDVYGLIESYYSMGRMYFKKGDFLKAGDKFKKTIALAGQIGERSHLTEAYDYLSRCDSADNNFKEAYTNIRNYARAKDSLLNEENVKQMAEMQTKYETEKKELQISSQEKEIEKQTAQKIAFAIGFVLMIFLALLVFRSYKLKKKANIEITLRNRIIEQKNKEILDSIHYAKRIQRSLMPTETYIDRILKKYK